MDAEPAARPLVPWITAAVLGGVVLGVLFAPAAWGAMSGGGMMGGGMMGSMMGGDMDAMMAACHEHMEAHHADRDNETREDDAHAMSMLLPILWR